MNNFKICMVCNEYNNGINQVVVLSDNDGRNKTILEGHCKCTDEVFDKIRKVKDLDKKSVSKVLKEIGWERNNV